ncbi:cubilin [Bombina bombina]|uniref:cubilin n=1 Tax=Bombina bombina TaxID=8345 RepID=UPI00235A54F2|nr:cubilin [Bombina bombina]
MISPGDFPWIFAAVLILFGLQCNSGDTLNTRQKRDTSNDQPRMSSENGNLIFSPSQTKNIEFKTGTYGKIKVNEDDLAELLTQIHKNKAEIAELKENAAGSHPNVTNQINHLNSKIIDIEARFLNFQQMVNRKACSSNPCQHSGTCIDLLDAFFCLCTTKWQGPFCADDVNECQLYDETALGCHNGGICSNTPGSYSCSCPPEWFGPQCLSKYDDCKQGSLNLCVHGICVDSDRVDYNQPKYSCVCDAGWMSPPGSPACTADIDECSLDNPPCSQNPPVQCINREGSFTCGPCPSGWQGNGYSCKDINECETNNGGCSLNPLVQCLNTMGSYYCGACPPGYEGDGRQCTQKDACSLDNGVCHPLASCVPNEGSILPICVCPPGYLGNGYGSTGCLATSDICKKHNPCVNGECKPTVAGYVCECNSGWNGPNCTENINECSSNPCQNGGTCTDAINSYSCNCTSGWTGFHCETPTQECGGILTGLSGTLSYPITPDTQLYDHAVSCVWVIRTALHKILHITFSNFNLATSMGCSIEALQIHDGESVSDEILGTYCSSTAPEPLFSSNNVLNIWFHSNHSLNTGRFTISWESQEPECGSHLSGNHGSIYSPGYPNNYPLNHDCYWTISADPGLFVTFAFGTLYLENHENCDNDYLEIRDGLLSHNTVLGKYCKTQSPAPLQTSGPYAWIRFHSDNIGSDRGFHITYITSPSGPDCGGNFAESEGYIQSPSWPNSYTGNKQCIYIIRQGLDDHVNLRFTHLELKNSTGCALTYIEIRDGDTEASSLIGKYCDSTIPASITSSSNSLWIKYKSDSSVTSSFRAFYQVACGGALSGSGQIRTPHYPNAYHRERTCEWVITQPIGTLVVFNFNSFNVLTGPTCGNNYVEVRDGPSAESKLIGKYCGPEMPPSVQSTQRNLYVKFVTDSSEANRGFLASFTSVLDGCGGTHTAPEGTIRSPGYPEAYPHGIDCTWVITVQPGNFIRLSFDFFHFQHFYTCSYDYLEIFDSDSTAAAETKVGRYCGRSIPPSITSSDNKMTLLMVTDSSVSTEGFSANYISVNASTVCDAELMGDSGIFTSPNYPNSYPNNRECIYTITVETNKQIALNFTTFALNSFSSCDRDYVEIRDGGYRISPLLGTFCSEKPPAIISHSNKLWIKFKSDNSLASSGFSAHWEIASTGCGATLTTVSGSFTSPNYPMPYYHNSECYWLLKASSGNILEIEFEHFNLESGSDCVGDYLAIYDGNNTYSHLLEKLCGNRLPDSIRSTGNNLYVKLRTDRHISYSGFHATYRQVCQNVVIGNRNYGALESLNYPNKYPEKQHCNWTIQTTAGNTINYTFTTFDIDTYCLNDNVKLYDGPNTQGRLIGTFCGSQLPPSGSTNSTSLHVVFNSDVSYVLRKGFQLLWNVNGCGGELFGSSGSFNSPGYPNKYPSNKECIWYIQTSPGSSIQITILEFSIEYHSSCSFDVLEIYGGPGLSSPRLAQLCASRSLDNPLHVSSTGNRVAVRFKTDSFVSGKGFNATWHEVPGGCGGLFQASSGEIHSQNYPKPYENNTECSWTIRVDFGHRVLLEFTDFDIEFHSSCSYDTVSVYDGPDSDSQLLAVLCGQQLPSAITSTQNTMFVRLRSDSSKQHKGFSARFSEACGSIITADSVGAVISSPLYPVSYPNNQSCIWIIQAQEPFNHVTISFTDFNTEDRYNNCTTDFVEILDGDNYDAPLKGRYCGSTIPHPITSYSNALVLKFISNSATNAKGFKASYAASTSACGGTLHMETGAFNSPGYPEDYPANIECVWSILSSPGNRLLLSFITFSLQESSNCSHDYLEIREDNETGALKGRFCGNTLPSNITSIIGHILWIKFVTNSDVSGSGFRATFSHLYGNTFFGTHGQISSPLWPRNYPDRSNYIWKINVDSSQIIEARILEIDIEDHARCLYDKLHIYDGPDTHFHIIGTYCGVATPPSLFSSGNVMTVQFSSDRSVNKKGFLLEWTAIETSTGPLPTIAPGACGGILRTGEVPAFFFSPGWPNNYPAYLDCTWVIKAPESTVELNILAVDIETHGSCNYDKLVIRDGDNNNSPELATVCGREAPGPIRSSGDNMFIRFSSDGSSSGGGFNASYHKSCGGYLHADRGVITSPHYPENYSPDLSCTWHVVVTKGFTIAAHFEQEFQIQNNNGGCTSGDFIELRNGPYESAPPLGPPERNGKFCGNTAPSTMHTSDNEMFVRFVSDNTNEGKGFKLKYEAKSLACGGTIYVSQSDPSGFVSSPKYPENYPQNADCAWTIIVPNSEAVQLDFKDQFYIEPSTNCSSSYLELHDGTDTNKRLIAKLCGNTLQLPATYKSLGNVMYMRFRSDSGTTRTGFNAMYSIATCGGTLFGQSGIIQSPGYPTHNYPDSNLCEWYFNGPTGHYLTISFEALDIQKSTDCSIDYVEIREYNASGRLLGVFCNSTIPNDLVTSDSFAYIKFVSDGSINATGFRLRFEASIEECGGEYTGTTGTLSSPNYPNLYPHNRECQWRITVPEGKLVTLTINDLRIQDHPSCDYDYVAIYNGFQDKSPMIVKLCNNVAPDTEVKSSGNTMKVIFVTDGSVSNGGFMATYTSMEDSVCGGLLSESTGGIFKSPGYDGVYNYTKNLNCEWVLQNPNHVNSSTYISFQTLQLENHQNCQNDFIEFRLGDADGELLTRLCGNNKPSVPVTIVAPQIWVHFVSNAEVEALGFNASYTFTGCGGIQTGESGVISSPNYPQPYNNESHCAWLLDAPEGYTISLSFTHLDIVYKSACRSSSVTVINGGSVASPVIGQYCGTVSPGTLQSGSNKMLVIFNSDNSPQAGGFYASWTSDSLGCGGYIHADIGNVKSPGWPQNFPPDSRCTWIIQAHASNHLEMTFDNNFHIPDNNDGCQRSYVKIWGGSEETQEAPLAHSCGNSAPGTVVTPNSIGRLTFQSQDSPGSGFSASFISRCGVNFTGSNGQIVTTNYPNKYDNNLNCNYSIMADADTYVVLVFETFELECNQQCRKDGVKIYNNERPTGTLIATHCSDTVPAPVSTKGPMSINFYTDSETIMHGFLANYWSTKCGGIFNSSSGILKSPTHSFTNYHNNMNCTYHVIAQENKIVELKFNSFDVEQSSSCLYDYVAVYDGSDIYSPLLGRFCGNVLPTVLRSTSNNLFLVFKTDSTATTGGWKASFRQTLGPLQGCGGYLSNPTGNFGSPDSDFDGKYDKNLDCVWYISVPINKVINLTFASFALEAQSSGKCQYDFVKIFDSRDTTTNLQGTFCGSSIPAPFVSSSNFLTVWFISDSNAESTGFNATYVANDLICGGIYNATSNPRTTATPNFPDSYPPFTQCVWTLDAPEKENLKIEIKTFNLQVNADCSENYIELKDFPVGDYGQVHKYCSNETIKIPEFYSYSRTAVVIFKSQQYTTGNGFIFTYQTANCSREYNQSFGYVKSPGWPGGYPHKTECTIILRAPENHKISLFFNSFHLEISVSCPDYLEVWNGTEPTSTLIGKYCGNSLPNPIFPNNNVLRLLFKSDIIINRDGYEITWTSSPTGCGGTLFGDHGSFTSPHYPGTYSSNTDCEWTILAPLGRLVRINFVTFSIEDEGDCVLNYLKIYNGSDASSPVIGSYCGTHNDIAPINTTSHQVFIKFHAETVTLPSGFRLTWNS